LPPVTPLTLSPPAKATLLWLILWRCCATAEHGIAQAKTALVQSTTIRWTAGVGFKRTRANDARSSGVTRSRSLLNSKIRRSVAVGPFTGFHESENICSAVVTASRPTRSHVADGLQL